MIYKELKLQEALGDLLRNMYLIPEEDQTEDNFFYDIYWKASLYSFFDANIWIGVTDDQVIRRKIGEKMTRVKDQMYILIKIERNPEHRKRMKKIIETINNFDSSNGFLTDVIMRIKKLNQDFNNQ